MRERFYRMMYGRYGLDQLSQFLSISACILLFVSLFAPGPAGWLLWVVSVVFLILAMVRVFSRNIYQRRTENARYLSLKHRLVTFFRDRIQRFKMRRYYRFFKCPGCRVVIRIPRGKGNIMVTCPRCRTSFHGRS